MGDSQNICNRVPIFLVGSDPFYDVRREELVALSVLGSCPISYGTDITNAYRQAGCGMAGVIELARGRGLHTLAVPRCRSDLPVWHARDLPQALPANALPVGEQRTQTRLALLVSL